MYKANIPFLQPCISSYSKILGLLGIAQEVPFAILMLIKFHIIELGEVEENDICRGESDQDFVTPVV